MIFFLLGGVPCHCCLLNWFGCCICLQILLISQTGPLLEEETCILERRYIILWVWIGKVWIDFSWEQFYLGMISYILFLFFVWPPQRSLKCMTCSTRDPIYCLTSGLDVMSSTLGQRVVKVIQAFFTLTCDQNWVTWVRSWFLTLYTTTTSSLHYDLFFVRSPVPICSITFSILSPVPVYPWSVWLH